MLLANTYLTSRLVPSSDFGQRHCREVRRLVQPFEIRRERLRLLSTIMGSECDANWVASDLGISKARIKHQAEHARTSLATTIQLPAFPPKPPLSDKKSPMAGQS